MIRELKNNEAEINKVMKIWRESTIKGHPFISSEYWDESYETVKNEYLPISKTYVYEDGEIKGFISIIEGSFIGALFVAVNHQNQGVGRRLLDYVKNLYPCLSLCVYRKNVSAVTFYEKNGFKIIATELNEGTKEEEYIMEYTLVS